MLTKFKFSVCILLPVFLLSSCFSLIGTRSTYQGGGNSVTVNGAQVAMEVRPEGTTGPNVALSAMVVGVGVANLDGPFRWRISAVGEEGVHEAMYVTAIRTVTSKSGRDEWYPKKYLGGRTPFLKKKRYAEGEVRAEFEIPGKLVVKPLEDGYLDVLVELAIESKSKRVKKVVRYRLDPTKKKENQTIFVPAEIISHIGKPMSEWEDSGWDR